METDKRLSAEELEAIASDWETGTSEECRTIRALLAHIASLTRELNGLKAEVLGVISPILQGPAGVALTSEQCKQLVLLEDRLSRAAAEGGSDDLKD